VSAEDVRVVREALDELTSYPWPKTDEIKARILPALARLEACLADAERERDDAIRVPAIFLNVLPTVIGHFFDDAHNAWADGREHEWDQVRFESEVRKAIYDETRQEIPDSAALIARAEAAEARLARLERALKGIGWSGDLTSAADLRASARDVFRKDSGNALAVTEEGAE
jgi:hypothetical protein